MNESGTDDCLVCRKHRGETELFGGIIYEDDWIFISHAQLWGEEKDHYLGHIFIEPRRHVAEIADLTDQEAQRLGIFMSRIAKALLSTQGMEHIYAFIIGDGVPHVHVHIIGRYPGAPREFWGPKVDEWPEAPRGKAAEIEQLADRVRDYLEEIGPRTPAEKTPSA
jgi:diadenosine tetraphosphate (Ap4A) HIT family hydrolase